ncbi:MAG: NADH-quinone oxidoreductase subunit G [Candidatus Paracaedibacteraceae bacterium]|nr:NADH-quinone oxidoreductase subunit G [Candidatus Paracaedibacteraceae bacterium]
MVKVIIDHKPYEFDKEISIIEACHKVGIQIPHFCYHPKLEIAGNCRMCLVEVEGSKKPIPSCANNLKEGMIIHTTSSQVKKDREGVMEFLLINHPLDCPVCDQAGECDLQDQALHYGKDRSRYTEEKRAVTNKYMGPLISTIMTRCIHCMRCVRFIEDVAGIPEVGAIGRGEHMEITTYLEGAITSELSGNVIDLCPVGALNSKPYQFKGRPWELLHTDTIDVMDALGSHIRIDSRGGQVFKIKPREMEEINEIWLSDKSRFSYDGLLYQRLDRPYMRNENGQLVPVSWHDAIQGVVKKLSHTPGHNVSALAGELVDAESMLLMKRLMQHIGSQHFDCRTDNAYADASNPASFVFNTSLNDIEHADVCLLIGTNPRMEAATLNVRLRRGVVHNGMRIFRIGPVSDLTYPVTDLGNNIAILNDILNGNNMCAAVFNSAKRPALIIGQSALQTNQGAIVFNTCAKIAEKYNFIQEGGWNGFNVLHTTASRVGGLDVGFVPGINGFGSSEIISASHDGRIKVVFLLGADEIAPKLSKDAYLVYIGHHGDKGAQRADIILPGAAYTEKDAIYVNTEGRSQCAYKAVNPPGDAKADWEIYAELLRKLGYPKIFNNLADVRKELQKENIEFAENYTFKKRHWDPRMGTEGILNPEALKPYITNFYMTNIISKYSKVMAQCTQEITNVKVSHVE